MSKKMKFIIQEALKDGVVVKMEEQVMQLSMKGVRYENVNCGIVRIETEEGKIYDNKNIVYGWLFYNCRNSNSTIVINNPDGNNENAPEHLSFTITEDDKRIKIKRLMFEIHSDDDTHFDGSFLIWYDSELCDTPFVLLSRYNEKIRYEDMNGNKQKVNASVILIEMIQKLAKTKKIGGGVKENEEMQK